MGRSQGGVRFPLPDLHPGEDSDGYGFKRVDLRERAWMSQESIEQRLAAVETAVSEIQRRLERLSPSPNWLSQVIGSLKDEPAFEEVIAYGKAIREADQLPDPDGESA
jgi:hypothetical protein